MQSVLNFFGVYIFHFMGYAIAFHVLLPQTDDFKSIGDGTLKVNMDTNVKKLIEFFRIEHNRLHFKDLYSM